jgi:hypothetical protein
MYARHFTTNYIVETGNASLVSRKMNIGFQVGLNIDYVLKDKWLLRTGYSLHAHTISEISYGTSGKLPPAITGQGWLEGLPKYDLGTDYIERFSHTIPLKLAKKIIFNKKEFLLALGPAFTFYNKTTDQRIRSTILLDDPAGGYTPIKHYEIIRNFESNKKLFLGLSKPFIEWQIDVEMYTKFKKTGALIIGLKANIGTTSFEEARFVIWPDEPNYKSTGRFSLNRSYIGFYAGYRFGKNK